MRAPPVVTLLTDFGVRDPFVGIMKGVILGICRDLAVVDLCHEVPAHDILGAGFLLEMSVRAFPAGTIHVAVVDPGVGGERRAILAEMGGQLFVAPDNGLLSYLLASPGQRRIRHLTAAEYWRHPVSASFHGRDIFAPVAGHLAAGVDPGRFGPEIDDPVCLDILRPRMHPSGSLQGAVIWVDRFGNCITNVSQRDLELLPSHAGQRLWIRVGRRPVGGGLVGHFAEVAQGESGAVFGSAGYLELFCYQRSLAQEWGIGPGDQVNIEVVPERDDGREGAGAEAMA